MSFAKQVQILNEVRAERDRQDKKWGGAEHDDTYTPNDWHDLLTDYVGWTRRMLRMGSPDKARRRFIQIAAICVAAVESLDRKASDGESK